MLEWLKRGYHANMTYMAANVPKRLNPRLLADYAQSVICLAVGYAPARQADASPPIARFARGRDYHKVLKNRCRKLLAALEGLSESFVGRAFVDSGPIAERSLAAAAGLGWIGRNGCLIIPGMGSYVALCEIVCNLPLAADSPLDDQCKNCRICLKACPTGALGENRMVDANKCISYLTVERHGDIPHEIRPFMGGRIFGCDACQELCPHNQNVPAGDAELTGGKSAAALDKILRWTPDDYDLATRSTTIRRTGYEALVRNCLIAAGNSGDVSLIDAIEDAAARFEHLAPTAQWALEKLRQ